MSFASRGKLAAALDGLDRSAPIEALSATSSFGRVRSAGDIGALAVRAARLAVKPPWPWARDAVVEVSSILRRCSLPVAVGHTVFLLGFGIILFGVLLTDLGTVDRQPGGIWTTWVREESTWITAMIFAGMVGSAVTADLGARKIREELDALSVLGVEAVRSLVLPRVVALTIALPLLAVFSLVVAGVVNYLFAPGQLDIPREVVWDNWVQSVLSTDLVFMLFKTAVLGFFVGVVACQKGLSASSGAEGVGQAVNQTAVITFAGIWLFNSLVTLAYLSLFPDVSVLRG